MMASVFRAVLIISDYIFLFALICLPVLLLKLVKVKKNGGNIRPVLKLLAVTAVVGAVSGMPYTKSPKASLVYKNISGTQNLSEDEVNDAMEACREYFKNSVSFNYSILYEMDYTSGSDGYLHYVNGKERTYIYARIQPYSIFADYMAGSRFFIVERDKVSREWTVSSTATAP